MLSDKMNYTADISYLTNTFITEYDISKANINVLYTRNIINKETYDYLYSAKRMERQRFVGMMQKNDHSIVRELQKGIIEAKQNLFEANNIQDHDVLSIKNDAVFIISKHLEHTKFGLIEFMPKNVYTSFYKLKSKILNLELYYYYNNIDKAEVLEIKGLSDKYYSIHEKYFIQIIKDILYAIQVSGPEVALRMIKDIYKQYVSLQLPVEYYRRMDNNSDYHFKYLSSINTGYCIINIKDEHKPLLDISYNLHILTELQKIVTSIYFDR